MKTLLSAKFARHQMRWLFKLFGALIKSVLWSVHGQYPNTQRVPNSLTRDRICLRSILFSANPFSKKRDETKLLHEEHLNLQAVTHCLRRK